MMPLSVYCKMIFWVEDYPLVKEYLKDPIRSNIPIAFLPEKIRKDVFSLKYVYKVSEDVRRLCYMGLIRSVVI